jgi:hypothetical protein
LLLVNFVMYKICYIKTLLQINVVYILKLNYKLCYIACKKLAVEACQEIATLYPTGMSVLYSAQCTCLSMFCVQICLKAFVFYFASQSIYTFVIFGCNG